MEEKKRVMGGSQIIHVKQSPIVSHILRLYKSYN